MKNIVNFKSKCIIIEITQIYWKLSKMVAIKKVKLLCHFSQQISFVVNHNKISYKLEDTWHIDFDTMFKYLLENHWIKLKITLNNW
jgi:hypothetical protein